MGLSDYPSNSQKRLEGVAVGLFVCYRYCRLRVQRTLLYTAAFMLNENLIIRYLINGYTRSILCHSTTEGYHQIYATSEFRFRLQTDHILALT